MTIVLCVFSLSYADSTDKVQGQELTPKQEKELAKEVGIILPGMTKDEVKETFGLLAPKIWYTPEGQEVWHYKVPEPHDIYFKDDKVERVDYAPKPIKLDKTQPKEI